MEQDETAGNNRWWIQYGVKEWGGAFVLIGLVTGVVYNQIFDNYFLNDDYGRILALYDLQNQNLFHAFVSLFTDNYHAYYRPFSELLLFLLTKWVGLNDAFFWYLSSVFLHVLSSITIYWLARDLIDKEDPRAVWFALISALLFAVHPRQVESISYVHDSENIICGLFYFVSLLCFVRYCKNRNGIYLHLFSLCFLFSLFGKEMGVTLPLICLAYFTVFCNPRPLRVLHRDPIVQRSVISLGITFLFYITMRYLALGMLIGGEGGTAQLDFSLTRMARTLIQANIAMVVPNDIPGMNTTAHFFRSHIVWFLILGFAAGCVILWKLRGIKSRCFWMGVIWCQISLLPILNNGIGVDELTGGRYLYISLGGFSLCIAYLLIRIRNTFGTALTTILILIFLSGCTYRNNTMMSFVSRMSEGFLKGIGEVIDHTQGKNVVVLLPAMYKGLYMLPSSLEPGITLLYGDRGAAFLKQIRLVLWLKIERANGIALDVSRGPRGSITAAFNGNARFLEKNDNTKRGGDQDLRFEGVDTINRRGDQVARIARFYSADIVISPNFKDLRSGRVVVYTVQGDSIKQSGI